MAYNVLVVDDSAIVRSVVIKTLKISGVELGDIYEAENGQVAMQKLEDGWIDIVFLDINMPVMTGIELVSEMTKRDMLKSSPVVIISTERSEARIRELKEMGVSAYLNKPFTPEAVREVVDGLLK